MTDNERQLILLLAELCKGDIARRVEEAGLAPGEGAGRGAITQIDKLVSKIKSEASGS